MLIWLLVVGAGVGKLWSYSSAPGVEANPPALWPGESRVPRLAGRPVLVVIAHPQCACSRATLGELALLMARVRGRAAAHVLFSKPQGVADDWVKTDLWTSAAAIPGVTVSTDDGGVEARRFGAATSGATLLYDGDGRLRFSGGLTSARGHSGDNAGRAALYALLIDGAAELAETPVFGCPLEAPATRQG